MSEPQEDTAVEPQVPLPASPSAPPPEPLTSPSEEEGMELNDTKYFVDINR